MKNKKTKLLNAINKYKNILKLNRSMTKMSIIFFGANNYNKF